MQHLIELIDILKRLYIEDGKLSSVDIDYLDRLQQGILEEENVNRIYIFAEDYKAASRWAEEQGTGSVCTYIGSTEGFHAMVYPAQVVVLDCFNRNTDFSNLANRLYQRLKDSDLTFWREHG